MSATVPTPSPEAGATSPPQGADHPSADTLLAVRNGLKLFASLLCTWGISIAVRLLLPRHLGPELFGELNFADAFSATFFVIITLGVDTYIRTEVAVRPEHASDFFGGLVAVRILGTGLLLAALAAVMHATGRAPEVRRLVYCFAFVQLFLGMNETLSALLHARGSVDGLSVVNVVSKLSWGLGILAVLVADGSLWWLGIAYLFPEVLKSGLLFALGRRNLGLTWRLDWRATRVVLVASLPFYLTTAAHTAYGRLDTALLAFVATDIEVGWYGAASSLALLTMIITPLIGWVMQPLLAKAAARSEDALTGMMRRSMELVLCLAIPVALAIGVGADVWVNVVFGKEFQPAALALSLLAPRFLLSYVSIFLSICLMTVGRSWTVTFTSLAGLVVNPILNLLLIGPSRKFFGMEAGGGGAGCAIALVVTEALVLGVLLSAMGRRVFDRRSVTLVVKSLAAALVAIAVDLSLRSWGPARLLVSAAVYVVLVFISGALPWREMVAFMRARTKPLPPVDGSPPPVLP